MIINDLFNNKKTAVAEGSKMARADKSAKAPKPKDQQEYDAVEQYRKDLAQSYNKEPNFGIKDDEEENKWWIDYDLDEGVAEGSLEEVSQQTLQSYRKKASAQKRAADDVVSGDADDETWKKNVSLSAKRRQGIDAANKRLGVAEGSGPQVGDAVYYGKRLVGWFKGYSEHGKIITEPNYEEMGDEYANRDVYWDPQDKITIKPEQGMAEGSDAEAYKQKLLSSLPQMMRFYEKNVQGWKPSEEQMLAAVETGYTVMKHTGDVKQAGKAVMDELNTLHRMSQGQQGVAEDKGMSGYNKFKKEWRAKHGDTKPVPGYDSKEYTQHIYQQNDKKKGVAENMADDMAAMAKKKFPTAYISKDGQEVQKPENWGKRYTPPPAAPADLEKQQRDLTAKYPNIDELVRKAELNRDPDYEMADGEAYYAARDAEQNYQKLRQIQRVIQGLNESLNRSHLP